MHEFPIIEEPKKRDRRGLNAYTHRMTGGIHHESPEEEIAYNAFSKDFIAALGPQGAAELEFARAIADDRWRLQLGAELANSIFELGVLKLDQISEDPAIDRPLKKARCWILEGKSIALLSLYEQRIQRKIEKNMKILRDLQKDRIAAFEKAVAETEILMQSPGAKGESIEIDCGHFVFSSAEITRRAARNIQLAAAKKALPSPKPRLHRV